MISKPSLPVDHGFDQIIKDITNCDDFTVLLMDHATKQARRIYSSSPEAFPLQGTKPMPNAPWAIQLIEKRVPLLSKGHAEITETFSDYQQILACGIYAILNIPIVRGSICLGSVNCLYSTTDVPKPQPNLPLVIAKHMFAAGLFKE